MRCVACDSNAFVVKKKKKREREREREKKSRSVVVVVDDDDNDDDDDDDNDDDDDFDFTAVLFVSFASQNIRGLHSGVNVHRAGEYILSVWRKRECGISLGLQA